MAWTRVKNVVFFLLALGLFSAVISDKGALRNSPISKEQR